MSANERPQNRTRAERRRRRITTILGVLIVGNLLAVGFVLVDPARAAPPVHAPIAIEGDHELATRAEIEDWSGAGTELDPYVIGPYAIVASDRDAVILDGTTAHVVLRGLALTITSTQEHVSGVQIRNAQNVRVEDGTFNGGFTGVRVRASSDVTITDNTFTTTQRGVVVETSTGVTIDRNDMTGSRKGALLVDVTDSEVRENSVYGWTENAIAVIRGDGVMITDNDIGDGPSPAQTPTATVAALYVEGSLAAVLSDNSVTPGDNPGIVLRTSIDTIVTGNTVRGASVAITAQASLGGALVANAISGGGATGVLLSASRGVLIADNDVRNQDDGLLLEARSDGNTLQHNIIADNMRGLSLAASHQNLIFDNRFANDLYNAQDVEGTGNLWSVEPRPGPNIAGGAMVGGNLWSDHVSPDVDGDGLGEVPYGVEEEGYPGLLPVEGLLLSRVLDVHPVVDLPGT